MPSAIAKIGDTVIADSENTMVVEGNHYFPEADIDMDLLSKTDLVTACHWKGDANYYNIEVDGKQYENASWTYHAPKTKQAEPLKDMIAFYGTMVDVKAK